MFFYFGTNSILTTFRNHELVQFQLKISLSA
jgi:hypothetical protein